jgi:uncharacterized protein
MSLEVGRQALAFGAGLDGGSCGIGFFGGEPLLARGLIEALVGEARAMERRGQGRFHFKVTTNGLLLTDGFLDFAARHDILVAMSCDGIRPAHDRHRRLATDRPSFDLILPRLRALLAARPYASIMLTVNPDTAPDLADSIGFLLDEGARYVLVSLNYAVPWTEDDLAALERQYERLADLYVAWTRAGRKFYLSPFDARLASHIKGAAAVHDRCELGRRQLSVDPAGHVYPCVQFAHAGPDSPWRIGHVATGLERGALRRLARESLTPREPCRRCAIRRRCNHTCGCLNWQTTGQVTEVSPVVCRHEQMLLPIADRVGATLYSERDPLFLAKHYNPTYPLVSLLHDMED